MAFVLHLYRGYLLIVAVSVVAFVLYSLVLNGNPHLEQENGCSMSYYHLTYVPHDPQPPASPSWIPLDHSDSHHSHRLFRYLEHGWDSRKVRSKPIVFIHGNSGSFMQIRSLASRLSSLQQTQYGVIQSDYYSIDFQEEKSGLSGRLVWRQALYVNECLRTILARYPKGTSAILVAHSMGGIIARGIFHLPNFFAGSVSTILTLGSPHRQPYIHADRYLAAFYDKTNSFWALATVNNTVVPVPPLSSLFPASASSVPSRVSYRDVSNVLLISISGGFRDHMIEPHLADLSGLTPAAQSLSVLTHSIPDVRLTVDHQCLLWCSQLCFTVASSIIHIVRNPTKANNVEFQSKLYTSDFARVVTPVIDNFRNMTPAIRSPAGQFVSDEEEAAPCSSLTTAFLHDFNKTLSFPIKPCDDYSGMVVMLTRPLRSILLHQKDSNTAPVEVNPQVISLSSLPSPLDQSIPHHQHFLYLSSDLLSRSDKIQFIPTPEIVAQVASLSSLPSRSKSPKVIDDEILTASFFKIDKDHWLDYSTSEDFSRLRHSQNPSRDHNSPSPNSASTLYTPLQALKLDKVWTYIRSLLALPLPKSYSFDLPLSDGINPKSPVYYWETVIPAGVDRYFELRMDHLSNPPVSAMDFSSPPSPSAVSPSSLTKPHLLKSANGVTYNVNLTNPFSLVYVSSVPLYPEDSIMIEDDYVTALNASTTVRFHRSSVHRLVRFLMIVHPGYSFKITISIQHLRSFLRAIYSHITAFPQILFATLFVLMAQQLYHFVKMGGFPRVYNIFRFGKRAVRGGNKLSLRGLGFDSGVSLAVCAWAALAVAVGAGPSDSGYAGLYGWATTYIDNHQHHHHHAHDSLAFDSSDLALNASSNTWQGWSSLLLLWGWELPLIGVSYFVFSALLLTISEGIWHVFFLCSAYLLYFAKRLLCSRAWFARVSQRLLTTGLIAVSVVVLHLFWLAAVGYLPIFDSFSTFPSTSAPFIDKAGYFFFSLRQNRVLSAMLVLHLAGWSAFVFSISSTWFTEAETPSLMRSYRAYKVSLFMLYSAALVLSAPCWVFEFSSFANTAVMSPPQNWWQAFSLFFTTLPSLEIEICAVFFTSFIMCLASFSLPARPLHLAPNSAAISTTVDAKAPTESQLPVSVFSSSGRASLLIVTAACALLLLGRTALIWLPTLIFFITISFVPEAVRSLCPPSSVSASSSSS